MADPDTLSKWRKGFEMASPETLRLLLARNEYDGDLRQQAVKWLREHDNIAAAIERKRFQTMLRWTIIGVVLAAAAPPGGEANDPRRRVADRGTSLSFRSCQANHMARERGASTLRGVK